MKTIGEYLFNSFEEALNFITAPTNYEKDHGIGLKETSIVFNLPDMKLVFIEKTDNTRTFILFFKNSTCYDIWKFWVMSELQLKHIKTIADIMLIADELNEVKRSL